MRPPCSVPAGGPANVGQILDKYAGTGNRRRLPNELTDVPTNPDPGQVIGARLAGGDESALEEAYATYSRSLLRFLSRYVGANEAEDVLQRTFLDLWRGAHRYDPTQRFSTWLFTLAHRRAVDTLRARRH